MRDNLLGLTEVQVTLVVLLSGGGFKPVGVEHLIAFLTPQRFQIPLTPRMFPVWNFVVEIFVRKALPNMGWVLSTF